MTLTMIIRTAIAALALVLVTAVSNCGADPVAPTGPDGQQQQEDGDDDGQDDGDDDGSDVGEDGGDDDGAEDATGDEDD